MKRNTDSTGPEIIRSQPIHWEEERAYCECDGEYKPTGVTLMSIPPQYVHKCDTCGDVKNFAVTYPHLVYEKEI